MGSFVLFAPFELLHYFERGKGKGGLRRVRNLGGVWSFVRLNLRPRCIRSAFAVDLRASAGAARATFLVSFMYIILVNIFFYSERFIL